MSAEFSGQCVLVTAAASGIGRETAFAFAEAGTTLVRIDIDPAGLERTTLLCDKLGAVAHGRVLRGGATSIAGIAPALRGGATSIAGIAPARRGGATAK